MDIYKEIARILVRTIDGGQGSGNWGHEGRLGKVGGSGKGGAIIYLDKNEISSDPHSHSITKHIDKEGNLS